MPDVKSTHALLIRALQDLHDAEAAMVERLGILRDHVRDPALSQIVAEDHRRSADQQERLSRIAASLSPGAHLSKNVWLRAIFDDAARDTETIEAGPLLDVALGGALRKAKQTERVSYETAIALARRLDLVEAEASLTAMRNEEKATDETLGATLRRLVRNLKDETSDTPPCPPPAERTQPSERAATR